MKQILFNCHTHTCSLALCVLPMLHNAALMFYEPGIILGALRYIFLLRFWGLHAEEWTQIQPSGNGPVGHPNPSRWDLGYLHFSCNNRKREKSTPLLFASKAMADGRALPLYFFKDLDWFCSPEVAKSEWYIWMSKMPHLDSDSWLPWCSCQWSRRARSGVSGNPPLFPLNSKVSCFEFSLQQQILRYIQRKDEDSFKNPLMDRCNHRMQQAHFPLILQRRGIGLMKRDNLSHE